MQKIYIVRLSEEKREVCLQVIKKLKGSSEEARRTHILLKADAGGSNWKDQDIVLCLSDPPEGRNGWTQRLQSSNDSAYAGKGMVGTLFRAGGVDIFQTLGERGERGGAGHWIGGLHSKRKRYP